MARRALILQLRMRTDTAEIHFGHGFRWRAARVQGSGAKERLSTPSIDHGHDQQRAGAKQESQR